MSNTVSLEVPAKLAPVFAAPNKRFRGAYGGRGSGKTRTFATMVAVKAYQFMRNGDRGVILCGREYMNTLEESSMTEIKEAIEECAWLRPYFDIGEKYIRTRDKAVSFVFTGLRHNLDSIKSKARILLAWIDEAETVSEMAWRKLTPTVREDNSEIWVTWNPEIEGSATDTRFRKNADDDMIFVEMNYSDNKWFPKVLEADRLRDRKNLDDNTYAWIWEGAYLQNSDKQVMAGCYEVREFRGDLRERAERIYLGADFGFAADPSTLISMFIIDDTLYIEYEAYGKHIELDKLPDFYDNVPESRRWPIYADCARPDTISYLKRQGFKIEGAPKWEGSIKDGIAYVRGFRNVVIHPRCVETVKEFRHYSYKTDRITGEVLPVIVDAFNHCIDAIRYGLAKYIRRPSRGVFDD